MCSFLHQAIQEIHSNDISYELWLNTVVLASNNDRRFVRWRKNTIEFSTYRISWAVLPTPKELAETGKFPGTLSRAPESHFLLAAHFFLALHLVLQQNLLKRVLNRCSLLSSFFTLYRNFSDAWTITINWIPLITILSHSLESASLTTASISPTIKVSFWENVAIWKKRKKPDRFYRTLRGAENPKFLEFLQKRMQRFLRKIKTFRTGRNFIRHSFV